MSRALSSNKNNQHSKQLMQNWVIKKPKKNVEESSLQQSENKTLDSQNVLQELEPGITTTKLGQNTSAKSPTSFNRSFRSTNVASETSKKLCDNADVDKGSLNADLNLDTNSDKHEKLANEQLESCHLLSSNSSGNFQVSDCRNIQPANQECNNRRYKFQQNWFKKFPWLFYDPTIGGVLCLKCCDAIKKNVLKETTYKAFTSLGFHNWKKGITSFETHESSSQHIESVEKLSALKQPPISSIISSKIIKEQDIASVGLECIVSSLKFLSRQGLAIQGRNSDSGNFMELLRLREIDVPNLKKFLERKNNYTSHDIQNEILKLFSHQLQRELIQEILESGIYSIIVDETTDIGTCEQVSINFRSLSDDLEPTEIFLGLYQTSCTTGEMLESIILDSLKRFGLELSNLRGQCYDGASNMSGIFKGVQARIMEREERAVYVHCFNHCLNLALQFRILKII